MDINEFKAKLILVGFKKINKVKYTQLKHENLNYSVYIYHNSEIIHHFINYTKDSESLTKLYKIVINQLQ